MKHLHGGVTGAGSRIDAWAASPWRLPVASGLLLPLAHYGGLLVPNFLAFVPMLVWLDARKERGVKERHEQVAQEPRPEEEQADDLDRQPQHEQGLAAQLPHSPSPPRA